MKFGAFMFPTDYSIGPVELGQACEERGFESLFFPEHTHIPTSRRTPHFSGGEMPWNYTQFLDPFVALSAVAAVTRRLRIGTAVCLVIEHDPITLAKRVSTLDLLSGGRLLFGIGGGWNREEMENHGTDPSRRWKLLRERVEAMKRIWTEDEPEYHGEFVDFDPIWQWPKPLQKPHPPVLLGSLRGGGELMLKRVVRYCDGWILGASGEGGELGERIQQLQRLAARAGRDPLPVTAFAAEPDPTAIEQLANWGVERCVFAVPPASAEQTLPLLDEQAKLIEQFPA